MTDLEQAREIIRDLLAERGLPQWLADIATEREALVVELRKLTSTYEYGERMCCDDADHARDCAALRFLRMLDPAETERQVNEAHEWAIELQRIMSRPPGRVGRARFTRFVGLGEATGAINVVSPISLGRRPGKSDVVQASVAGFGETALGILNPGDAGYDDALNALRQRVIAPRPDDVDPRD